MTKAYLLIALLTNTAGNVDSYVIDSGLSAEDCQTASAVSPALLESTLDIPFSLEGARLVCEAE